MASPRPDAPGSSGRRRGRSLRAAPVPVAPSPRPSSSDRHRGRDPLARLDPAGFVNAYLQVVSALVRRPDRMAEPLLAYAADVQTAAVSAALRAVGTDAPGPLTVDGRDKRYADPAWHVHPGYWLLRQQHGLFERMVSQLVDAADVEERTRAKAGFMVRQMLSASAPPNFFFSNPAAIKAAYDSAGRSALAGARNFLRDLVMNQGRPLQVVPGALQVGRDLAVTPGKVVFRNELMELLQYEPQTDTVHEVPLLLSPPWINKYYLLDLAPGRSLVEWAVRQGHTVFVISYRNPDKAMHAVSLDDYLVSGPRAALDVIGEITGQPQVNVLGLCLGGSLTAALVAYLAAEDDDRVRSVTLVNTLLDFSEPGDLGVFTDERTISRLEERMRTEGFLSGESMRQTFDVLRADDLIWSYAVNGWLLGREPRAFDILAWNADSTRMPAGMHSFYLRSCYQNNELARGEMVLAGTQLNLDGIEQDAYVVSAEQDHIAPWRSVYRGAALLPGRIRFVLSDAGHVAGVVNPPGGTASFSASDTAELPADPDEWLSTTSKHSRSWWEDWAEWIADRAGERQPPPPVGNERWPALASAPGTYVLEP